MNPNNENIIDKQTAIDWTTAWRSQHPNAAKAFLIPAADFVEILNEIGVLDDATAAQAQATANRLEANIRGYLGVDGSTNKMIFVGTEKDKQGIYRDIIDGKIDGKDNQQARTVGSGNTSSGIFDLTTPCPPVCDPDSPLS
ncbi:hypothetical protein [Aquimarina brevivitae]|uniref:Uncharacterized protein n=1 Tax=Aquimarina brevivitae TaxID=323412 RepID=A0A4Q7NV68_9FLAO|nr:hypothetical protein [Aquimarina brevivitae]RZS90758.1 hypothetical protein EV197_3289 [Aquimarina brevivitae]